MVASLLVKILLKSRLLEKARAFGGLNGLDLAKECCDPTGFEWTEGSWVLGKGFTQPELKFHVVAYDYGVKTNIFTYACRPRL